MTDAGSTPGQGPRKPRGRRPSLRPDRPKLVRDALGPAAVKSARRALEIFEYFHDYQRPATVQEISQALGYPQSSTSALLKTLLNLGYITHDVATRTYVSSARVSLLGAWMPNNLTSPGKVLQVMQRVRDATGETVMLVGRNDIFAQYLHILPGNDPATPRFAAGFLQPLTASGAGYAAMAHMKDEQVAQLARRINNEVEGKGRTIDIKTVLERVAEVRERGYSVFRHPAAPLASVHVALRPPLSEAFLTISVVCAADRLPEEPGAFAEVIRAAIAEVNAA